MLLRERVTTNATLMQADFLDAAHRDRADINIVLLCLTNQTAELLPIASDTANFNFRFRNFIHPPNRRADISNVSVRAPGEMMLRLWASKRHFAPHTRAPVRPCRPRAEDLACPKAAGGSQGGDRPPCLSPASGAASM